MNKNKAVQDLFNNYKLAFPDRKGLQKEAHPFWNKIKVGPDFKKQYEEKMEYLQLIILKNEKKALEAWVKVNLCNTL